MSEISAASIIHRTDEKEYITGYWQKRSTGFANLRKAELYSEKQLLWQQEITRHLPQITHFQQGLGQPGKPLRLLPQKGEKLRRLRLHIRMFR